MHGLWHLKVIDQEFDVFAKIPETRGLLCDLKLAEHSEEGIHFLYFAPYPLLFCKELSVFFFQCLAPCLLEGVSRYTQIMEPHRLPWALP